MFLKKDIRKREKYRYKDKNNINKITVVINDFKVYKKNLREWNKGKMLNIELVNENKAS